MKFSGWILGLALFALSAGTAQAAVVDSYFTNLNVANNASFDQPPFATVLIQEIDDGTIEFTVDVVGVEYAAQDRVVEQFAFNSSLPLEASDFSGLAAGWSVDTSPTASLSIFGKFGVTVDGGSGLDPLTFVITRDGDSIATYTSLLSDADQLFAVKTSASGPGAFVGGGTVVPIPAALPLFLSALAAFGFVTRRRRKEAAIAA